MSRFICSLSAGHTDSIGWQGSREAVDDNEVVLAQVVLPPLNKSGMWALRIIVQLRMQLKLETRWVSRLLILSQRWPDVTEG